MVSPSYLTTLRKWLFWAAIAVIGELAWFGLIYPLVPRTALGALVLVAVPLPLAGYMFWIVSLLKRLIDAQSSLWTRMAFAIPPILSIPGAFYAALWLTKAYFAPELGYLWPPSQ